MNSFSFTISENKLKKELSKSKEYYIKFLERRD